MDCGLLIDNDTELREETELDDDEASDVLEKERSKGIENSIAGESREEHTEEQDESKL